MCNEFFFWLAFDSVSSNRPSHVQRREKAELELLTGTVTKPLHVLSASFGFLKVSALRYQGTPNDNTAFSPMYFSKVHRSQNRFRSTRKWSG